MRALIAIMLALAIATPVSARTCVISDTPASARCHTQIYQSSVAIGWRNTSLVVACSDTLDGVASTVLTVRGRSDSLRVRWVDEDTLQVEYSERSKVVFSMPTVVLRDRTLKVYIVPVEGETGAGCDFDKDDIRNIVS